MQSACIGPSALNSVNRPPRSAAHLGLGLLAWFMAACLLGSAGPSRADLSCGFVKNPGLWGDSVQYLINGDRTSVYFTAEAVIVDIKAPGSAAAASGSSAGIGDQDPLWRKDTGAAEIVHRFAVWIAFSGANRQPVLEAAGELPTRFHYFLGSDPEQWRREVPIFSSIRYRDLWPGIDLVYTLDSGRLSYAIECRAGADPSQVSFGYEGAERVTTVDESVFVIETPIGNFTDERPDVSRGGTGQLRFPPTDSGVQADGDPRLSWSSLLGGGASYEQVQLARDAGGRILVASSTLSSYLPTTPGPHEFAYDGRSLVFVSKLDERAERLLWTAFLGGDRGDVVQACAVDPFGNLIITGRTSSNTFPFTTLRENERQDGQSRAFVAKLAGGGDLAWSLELGPGAGEAVAADASGQVFVAGRAMAAGFTTTGGVLGTAGGEERGYDAFVAKINAAGAGVSWSALLGGAADDGACAIALDDAGNPVITGGTQSTDFPATVGSYKEYYSGNGDIFVAKIDAERDVLLWSTILGGTALDYSTALTVADDGEVVLTGYTNSPDYPTSANSFAPSPETIDDVIANGDAFVTKLSASGERLRWSVRLGGELNEVGLAVAIDREGNHLVAGMTDSPEFPCRLEPLTDPAVGGTDAFVIKLDPDGQRLVTGTVFGGSGLDLTHSLVLDEFDQPVIGGLTKSSDFPTTAGAFDATSNGTSDVFIARIEFSDNPDEEGIVTPVPRVYLKQNHPNPFNPLTSIVYDLPHSLDVSLAVFDVSGRLVRVLRDRVAETAGMHSVVWDGRDRSGRILPSGVYIYRLDAGSHHEARRMMLVK